MKTSNFFKMALLAITASLVLTSCGKDDKEAEIVIDPVTGTTEYYIEGKVVANNVGLQDVTVTANGLTPVKTDANGQYSITVAEKGTYTVTFNLDGYMASADSYTGTVAKDATNRSIVTLNAIMSPKGTEVKVIEELENVKEDEVLVVTAKGTETVQKDETGEGAPGTAEAVEASVAVAIPSGAIKTEGTTEAPNISVTPYIPAASKQAASEKTEAALTNLKIESNVPVVVQKPVAIQISAVTSKTEEVKVEETFKEVKVYRKVATNERAIGDIVNGWQEIGIATFNPISKSYTFTLQQGERLDGEFSTRVAPTVSSSSIQNRSVASGEKSNAGNLSAIDFSFEYTAPTGWEAADITANVSATTKAQLLSTVTSMQNGAAGISNVTKTIDTKISGNYNLYYNVKVNYVIKTYTFELQGSNVKVVVTEYLNTVFDYKNESADTHSGGGVK